MRSSAFIAFFGIATAVSGALFGCSDDSEEQPAAAASKPRLGAEGDSCTRTDDCGTDLACISNVCLPSGTSGTGGSSGTGGTGGSGARGGSTGSLGNDGESCTKRADCAPPLGCFNQRCAEMPTGEGGAGPGPTVGGPGETCALNSDCEEGLVCRPGGAGAASVGFTGVCTDPNSGVTATGKVCGAECSEAADCCELPIEVHAALGATVKSCADLTDLLVGVDCDAATGVNGARCFANSVYCTCTTRSIATNWECTEQGTCLYKAACSANDLALDGCATYSRVGHLLTSTCDVGGTDRCNLPSGTPYCTTDASCDTFAVSDDTADTCNGGECTCLDNRCLRKCTEDLDCRAGLACDTSVHVCKPVDSCSDDRQCQSRTGDIRWFCGSDHLCTFRCENDLECNPAGFTNPSGAPAGGPFSKVCESNLCVPLGCTDDTECPPAATNGVARVLCTAQATAAPADTGSSAITD